jgi:hypothetical protein
MGGLEVDKWPPLLQAAAAMGALLAGFILYLIGNRKGLRGRDEDIWEQTKREAEEDAMRERIRLQQQLDINLLRSDLIEVVGSSRIGIMTELRLDIADIHKRLNDIDERLRIAEQAIAVLQAARIDIRP